MNMTAVRRNSLVDYSSFRALPGHPSRVKSAVSPTIPGDWALPLDPHDIIENNSFVYRDLSGARFNREAVEARQMNCYEVRWTGLTTPPDHRRLT